MSEHETREEKGSSELLASEEENFAARAASLSSRERKRFWRALALLRSGEGVLALTDGGLLVGGEGVYEALLAWSWALRFDNPHQMCHLAKVAVQLCQTFDPTICDPKRVADLKARAWGELANAHRVMDQLREARQAFGKAYGFWREGSGDRRLLMRLLDLEASLLGCMREYKVALRRLSTLFDLHKEAGEVHLAGRALITKALYTFYSGDTEQACQISKEGLILIDEERDPALVVVAAFNQLLFLAECSKFREAKKVLFKNRAKLTYHGRIAKLKLRAIEGLISYGLDELESSEIAFRESKTGLVETGLLLTAGLASLYLAMTLMRQGKIEEALQEGLESSAIFLSSELHHELLGSVIFLEQAFLSRTADLTLLESTARYLRKKMMELGLG